MCNHTSEETGEEIVLRGRVTVNDADVQTFVQICREMIRKQINAGERMFARLGAAPLPDGGLRAAASMGVSLQDSMQAPTSHQEVKADRKRTLEVASQAGESKQSTVKTTDLLPTSSQQDAETKTKASKKKDSSGEVPSFSTEPPQKRQARRKTTLP